MSTQETTPETGAPEVTETGTETQEDTKKVFHDDEGNVISQAAYKKLQKAKSVAAKKAAAEAERAKKAAEGEQKEAAKRAAMLEEAKSIKLENKLGDAPLITVAEVFQHEGKRVKIQGWAHSLRRQAHLMFIDLRDGTGVPNIVQVVFDSQTAKTYEGLTMAREATICVWGTLNKAVNKKTGVEVMELQVDYWELVHGSDASIENVFNEHTAPDQLLDQRHLVLRQTKFIYIMRLRSIIMQCFREHFWGKGFYEVTPPTIVQTQVEGGSTLFKFDYFGSAAYLTQSSQLYLETVVPVLGKVFCVMPSFRAEKSKTRRHLSEFTHFEGEVGFITFDDLLNILEDMVVSVAEMLVQKAGPLLKEVNPGFKPPKKPFKRLDYEDAIKWLNDHNIPNEETKEPWKFGDDIPEGPERKMTDTIGEPIFLCRFPTSMKPFYMQRVKDRPELTESCDLLMPGVGEIVGSSMRSWDLDQLLKGFEHEGIDPKTYYWYNDLRKYGSCPHGGWGLGFERYICWILGIEHIRDSCLYPRFVGRAQP